MSPVEMVCVEIVLVWVCTLCPAFGAGFLVDVWKNRSSINVFPPVSCSTISELVDGLGDKADWKKYTYTRIYYFTIYIQVQNRTVTLLVSLHMSAILDFEMS